MSNWPIIDGWVIPDDQYKLYEARHYNDTPVLIGTNADEGSLFVRTTTAAQYTAMVRAAYGDYADKILAAYPAADDAQALRSQRDLFRDTAFAWHTVTWARLQAKAGTSKVFVYYFTHRPPYPDTPMFKGVGASHGADIAYVFGNPRNFGNGDPSADDTRLSDEIMTYWTNFARTGDPNGEGVPAWPAFTGGAQTVQQLDVQPAPIALPNASQLETLDGYYAWRRSREP